MRNYEKFFTPLNVASRLCNIADIEPGDWILEPSAGCGSIIEAIQMNIPKTVCYAVEMNPSYDLPLRSVTKHVHIGDFLEYKPNKKFDKCIANPPFGNDTDLLAHFNHIRSLVKEGGIIVMIVPFDFIPELYRYETHKLSNWYGNSDGTITKIKIISFKNYFPKHTV